MQPHGDSQCIFNSLCCAFAFSPPCPPISSLEICHKAVVTPSFPSSASLMLAPRNSSHFTPSTQHQLTACPPILSCTNALTCITSVWRLRGTVGALGASLPSSSLSSLLIRENWIRKCPDWRIMRSSNLKITWSPSRTGGEKVVPPNMFWSIKVIGTLPSADINEAITLKLPLSKTPMVSSWSRPSKLTTIGARLSPVKILVGIALVNWKTILLPGTSVILLLRQGFVATALGSDEIVEFLSSGQLETFGRRERGDLHLGSSPKVTAWVSNQFSQREWSLR